MSSNPIVLVLGSGPRIGASIASLFSSSNYRVAIASRKAIAGTTPEGYLSIPADLSSPSSLSSIFSTVSSRFHQSPSIVIYNAAALTPPRDDDLFTIPIDNLSADLNVNTVSVYAAMQETVKGWETFKGEEAGRKCFIFTGNKQNTYIGPMLMTLTLGMGKSATAYLIGAADAKYKDLGYRFFYADERNEDGSIKGMAIDGDAHAQFYLTLARGEEHGGWHETFVKGKGYVKF